MAGNTQAADQVGAEDLAYWNRQRFRRLTYRILKRMGDARRRKKLPRLLETVLSGAPAVCRCAGHLCAAHEVAVEQVVLEAGRRHGRKMMKRLRFLERALGEAVWTQRPLERGALARALRSHTLMFELARAKKLAVRTSRTEVARMSEAAVVTWPRGLMSEVRPEAGAARGTLVRRLGGGD